MNTTDTVEMAIANISATSQTLGKMSNDPNHHLSPYASNLIERMSWELHKLADDLKEINYNYVS